MSEPTFERTLTTAEVANAMEVNLATAHAWRSLNQGPAWRENPSNLPGAQRFEYDYDSVVEHAARRRLRQRGARVPAKNLDRDIAARMKELSKPGLVKV